MDEKNENYVEVNDEEPEFAEGEILSEEKATNILKRGFKKAKEILDDDEKVERFLQRFEKKLELVPWAGEKLSNVMVLASLVRSYVKKEYKDIPIGTIIAAVSALVYFVLPVDIIPDVIPGAGYLDDLAVVGACLKLIDSDLKEYKKWREKTGKVFVEEI